MNESGYYRYSDTVLLVPMFLVLSIWTLFWVEVSLGYSFYDWGIYPRRFTGLKGVILSPFLHGSLQHLYNNTLPLAILSAALSYFYRPVVWKVLVFGVLLSGLLTWLIGRPSYHIGASGLIYVLASFIFFKGVFSKNFRLIALSLIVVFVYGSMLWYIFPIEDGISWEGHLSGFIVGLVLALILKVPVPERRKYAWEKADYKEEDDLFLRHFDADGNFIEHPEQTQSSDQELKINYILKKNSDQDLAD